MPTPSPAETPDEAKTPDETKKADASPIPNTPEDKKKTKPAKEEGQYVPLDELENEEWSENEKDKKKGKATPACTTPTDTSTKSPIEEKEEKKEKDKKKDKPPPKKGEYVPLDKLEEDFFSESEKDKGKDKKKDKEKDKEKDKDKKKDKPPPKTGEYVPLDKLDEDFFSESEKDKPKDKPKKKQESSSSKKGEKPLPSMENFSKENDNNGQSRDERPTKETKKKEKKKKKDAGRKLETSVNGQVEQSEEIVAYVAVALREKEFLAAFTISSSSDPKHINFCPFPSNIRDRGQAQLHSLQIVLKSLLKKNISNRPITIQSDFTNGFDMKRIKEHIYNFEYNEVKSLMQEFSKVSYEQVFLDSDLEKHAKLETEALRQIFKKVTKKRSSSVDKEISTDKKDKEKKFKGSTQDGVKDEENNNDPDEPDITMGVAVVLMGKEAALGVYVADNHKLNFSRRLPRTVKDQGMADVIGVQMAMRNLKRNCTKPLKSIQICTMLKWILDQNRFCNDNEFAMEYAELKKLMDTFEVRFVDQKTNKTNTWRLKRWPVWRSPVRSEFTHDSAPF